MSAVSSFMPTSSEMTVAPVSTAMSCSVALRLSPKPGALTAATWSPAAMYATASHIPGKPRSTIRRPAAIALSTSPMLR